MSIEFPRKWDIKFFVLVLFLSVVSIQSSHAGVFEAQGSEDATLLKYRVLASQFLSRATFGPSIDEINSLAQRMTQIGALKAFEEWIDQQFDLPATSLYTVANQIREEDGVGALQPMANLLSYRNKAWWDTAIRGQDQLRQRVAWALSQIFVVNSKGNQFNGQRFDRSGKLYYLGLLNYYDMLADNAFGNYRELLEDVTLHPIMGEFLSHAKNPKGNPETGQFPDENYAREVLQLFSIGLYEMRSNGAFKADSNRELIPTYDNETIKAFARVFTGLSFAGGSNFAVSARNFYDPMVMFDYEHDQDQKLLLNGRYLPAAQDGMTDIEQALDNIADHPNVPMFISRLLIQRLVMSNPSKAYISRVSRAFRRSHMGQRGNLKLVIKAILLDRDAIRSIRFKNLSNPTRVVSSSHGTESSRLQEPMLRYAALYRAFNASSNQVAGRMSIPTVAKYLNQDPFSSPSVFNFYLPNHLPAGSLQGHYPSRTTPNGSVSAPEFQIFTSVFPINFSNRLRGDINDSKADFNPSKVIPSVDISFDFTEEIALAGDPYQLLTHLDLLLCQGTMSELSKSSLAEILNEETNSASVRARGAILAVMTAPECAVQE